MARFGSLAAVAIGGTLGSLARWGLVSAVDEGRAEIMVFAINVVGSLLLGLIIGRREQLTDDQFALVGTGFIGGLTTFSTFALAVARRLEEGQILAAATNAVATTVVALMAGGLGYRLSRTVLIGLRPRRTR